MDRTRYMREGSSLNQGNGQAEAGGSKAGQEGIWGLQKSPPYLALCHLISGHRLGPPLFLEPLSPFPQASPTTEAQDLKETNTTVVG